jgi:hypothetical protein
MLEHVSRLYYITLYYVTLQYYIILCYITLHYTILYYSILNYVCIYIYVGTCILISIWFVLHLKNLPNTLYPSRSCLLSFVFFLSGSWCWKMQDAVPVGCSIFSVKYSSFHPQNWTMIMPWGGQPNVLLSLFWIV